jgi:hypothetical protein
MLSIAVLYGLVRTRTHCPPRLLRVSPALPTASRN